MNKRSSIKWKFLEHRGPVFPPPYKALPYEISFKYKGDSTFYLMFVSKLITRYWYISYNKINDCRRKDRKMNIMYQSTYLKNLDEPKLAPSNEKNF